MLANMTHIQYKNNHTKTYPRLNNMLSIVWLFYSEIDVYHNKYLQNSCVATTANTERANTVTSVSMLRIIIRTNPSDNKIKTTTTEKHQQITSTPANPARIKCYNICVRACLLCCGVTNNIPNMILYYTTNIHTHRVYAYVQVFCARARIFANIAPSRSANGTHRVRWTCDWRARALTKRTNIHTNILSIIKCGVRALRSQKPADKLSHRVWRCCVCKTYTQT